jgi:serine phosphatase RsbU (regulator of sigma subunit)
MEVQIAVAKINKWSMRESGDTFEMVERPHGGLSLVLVDGQSSGRGAKAISNLVARKAIALLGEGVRDGAAARAAHDYLYAHRQGKVSATLNIISFDLVSKTLVISRNTHCPVIVCDGADVRALDAPSDAIGLRPRTRPNITELAIAPQLTLIAFTDGLLDAGQRKAQKFDLPSLAQTYCAAQHDARTIADGLLAAAIQLDEGRPSDDISILVVATRENKTNDPTRRLNVSFPIE